MVGIRNCLVGIWKNKIEVNGYYYDRENYHVNFKRKKVSITLYDEEPYIKNITVPLVSSRKLSTLVKYEVGMNFKSIKNLFYWYKIREKGEKKMDITIYCINYNNEKIISDIVLMGNRIMSIDLYQFTEIQKVFSFIKENQSVVAIYNSNSLYFIYLKSGIPVYNVTVCGINNCEEQVIENSRLFLEHYLKGNANINKVYLINMDKCDFTKKNNDIELIKVPCSESEILLG